MLKQRVITALILAVLVIVGVLTLPNVWFGGFLILIIMLSAWEWTQLMGFSRIGTRIAYCGLVLLLLGLGWQLQHSPLFLGIVLILAGLYWCYVLFWLCRYTANPTARNSLLTWILSGCVILVTPWIALMALRNESNFGPYYVLFLLMLIWIADTGCLFCRTSLGTTQISASNQPRKNVGRRCRSNHRCGDFFTDRDCAVRTQRSSWFIVHPALFAHCRLFYCGRFVRKHG